MRITAFKVLSDDNRSALMRVHDYVLTYKPGAWVVAPYLSLGIFSFKSEVAAKEFGYYQGLVNIVRVEIEPMHILPTPLLVCSRFNEGRALSNFYFKTLYPKEGRFIYVPEIRLDQPETVICAKRVFVVG